MKMIIVRNIGFIIGCCLFIFGSCTGSNESAVEKADTSKTWTVETIVAMGKVIPKDGWTIVSTPISGIIDEVNVSEGDSVKKGQLLFRLKSREEELDVDQNQSILENLRHSRRAKVSDLKQEEIRLSELQKRWETSLSLLQSNAETEETVNQDRAAYLRQQEVVEGLKKQNDADLAREAEQTIAVRKARSRLDELIIRADSDGVITELVSEHGLSVNTGEELGRMIKSPDLIIEAEVDELFADSVQIGQAVEIGSVGSENEHRQGIVRYVGPVLMNKSILYETANEAEDRRVRPIHIEMNERDRLLVNTKVECRIKLN